MDVFNKHQKAIAIKTLRMSDEMADVMGGTTKKEAIEFLKSQGYSDKQITNMIERK